MIKLTIPRSLHLLKRHLLIASCLLGLATPLFAAGSFSVSAGTTNTSAQTLNTSGQTGTVAATGKLSVNNSGSPTVNVTATSGTITITNSGTIENTNSAGKSRALRDNAAGNTFQLINNAGGIIQAAGDDVFQMNVAGSNVTVTNSGSLLANAASAQVLNFNALTNGTETNIITNTSTGLIRAADADAIRPGVNGVVHNDGTIQGLAATNDSSDGIDGQTNSGITIVNAFSAGSGTGTGTIEGARHGITGGNTTTGVYTMSITNNLGGTIKGDNGSGINIDGINASELITIVNHGAITGNGTTADGDGVDIDGLVNLTNTGTIRSMNALNDTSEGLTVGGGTINNSGIIRGSISTPAGNTGVGRGITIAGVDKNAAGNPIPVTAPYANTTITNSGTIQGDSDSAIAFPSALTSGFTMTVTNQTGGMIEGGGATAAAIQGGPDKTIINNSGTIKADSSGKAIVLGSGVNTINILGGSASILGDVDGGSGGSNSLIIDPGTGNTFTYGGTITHFATAQVKSGTFSLSGTMNTTSGTSVVGGTLAGNGTVSGLVTVGSGGVISPGNSPGKLTLQTGVDFSGGGKYLWQLASLTDDSNGTAGTDFDQILLTGGNLELGGTSQLTLDFSLLGVGDPNSSNAFWQTNHDWTIIDGSGATNTGSTNFAQITDATFADGAFTTTTDPSGDTTLHFQSVPEPGSASLLVLGALGLVARRRRAR